MGVWVKYRESGHSGIPSQQVELRYPIPNVTLWFEHAYDEHLRFDDILVVL